MSAVGRRPGPIRVGPEIGALFAPILAWLSDEAQLDRRFTFAEIAGRSPPSLRVAIAGAGSGAEVLRILDWSTRDAIGAAAEAADMTPLCAVYFGQNTEIREVFLDLFTGWRLVGFGAGRHAVGLVLSEALHDRLLFTLDAAPPAPAASTSRWWWLVPLIAALGLLGLAFPPLLALYAAIGLGIWIWRNRPS